MRIVERSRESFNIEHKLRKGQILNALIVVNVQQRRITIYRYDWCS